MKFMIWLYFGVNALIDLGLLLGITTIHANSTRIPLALISVAMSITGAVFRCFLPALYMKGRTRFLVGAVTSLGVGMAMGILNTQAGNIDKRGLLITIPLVLIVSGWAVFWRSVRKTIRGRDVKGGR